MRAVFRADASADIGGGHWMRCLTLADQLARNGWHCTFAMRPDRAGSIPALAPSSPHRRLQLPADCAVNDEATTLRDALGQDFDLLVVDHYQRGQSFETACRSWAKSVMVIDDLANRQHDCDLLLDQSLGRVRADYKKLLPANCRVMLGAQYALLRPQFATARKRAKCQRNVNRPPRRVLVAMGASDPGNYTTKVIEALDVVNFDGSTEVTIDVVLGGNAPCLDQARHRAQRSRYDCQIHVDVEDMAERMLKADLAIGASGSSSWERCCLGLPTLQIIVAENQEFVSEKLAAAGACIVASPTMDAFSDAIVDHFSALIKNAKLRAEISAAAFAVTDGEGCQRAVEGIAAMRGQP